MSTEYELSGDLFSLVVTCLMFSLSPESFAFRANFIFI